jgi:hypothetical protein
MERSELLLISVRVLLVWTVLSVLAFMYREALGYFMLPFVKFGLLELTQDFSPGLKLQAKEGDYLIALSAWVLRPMPLFAGLTVNPGAEMTAGTHLTHTLVPPVITLTLVMAWPCFSLLQRVIACGLGLLVSLILVTATVPLLLLGDLEMMFQNLAADAGQVKPVSYYLDLMIFLEGGGRWLLAVVSALICMPVSAYLARKIQKTR